MGNDPAFYIEQAYRAGTMKQPWGRKALDGQEGFYAWVLKLKMDEGGGSTIQTRRRRCG